MQLTDKVILKKQYLDARGNVFPARRDPYLYGELPAKIRDNPDYVTPVAQVTVKVESVGAKGFDSQLLTGQDPNTVNLTPQFTKETFVVNEGEKKDITIPVTATTSTASSPETTPVVTSSTTPIANDDITSTPTEVVTQSTLAEDINRQPETRLKGRTRKVVGEV